jgi:glutamate--cysteine ligase
MGITMAAQTHFDYVSAADLGEKLRLQVPASPVVAALFVNSPLEEGVRTDLQSRRLRWWENADPARCGVFPFPCDEGVGAEQMIDWALTVPMMYRPRPGGGHTAVVRRPFGELMTSGFGDGTWPTEQDWNCHLDQLWSQVRVRRTLETRSPDAPPWPYFTAAAALWTGLTYHAQTRRAAINLLSGLTPEQLSLATQDITVKGLAASIGGYPVAELAAELLRLSRTGLCAMVTEGREPPHVLSYLDPIDEIADTGVTFADTCLDRWTTELSYDPSRYVETYRVPVPA